MVTETHKARVILVHTPHTLHVLTPDTHASVPVDFSELLQHRADHALNPVRTLLAHYRKLPATVLLSADLLPITAHPLSAALSRHAQRRFLQHYYPRDHYAQACTVIHADQRISLFSCALTTATLRTLLRLHLHSLRRLQQVGPLAGWVPSTLQHMPGTHLLLFNRLFARSLLLIHANQLTYIINQTASFEELFRCLSQQAPHCAWEQGLNLLDNPTLAVDAPGFMPWLDAWYWFAE